jgi:NADH dehydrogenase/NADH:ubiquinone oxidoreductase subunit G
MIFHKDIIENICNNYLFNETIARIEQADLVLLIGIHPRYEALIPIIHFKIKEV